jgi:hypothetical protein
MYYLLVGQDGFQILDMTEPIDANVLKLVRFFELNKQYHKEEILFYIEDLVITYQRNEEYMRSFKYMYIL